MVAQTRLELVRPCRSRDFKSLMVSISSLSHFQDVVNPEYKYKDCAYKIDTISFSSSTERLNISRISFPVLESLFFFSKAACLSSISF